MRNLLLVCALTLLASAALADPGNAPAPFSAPPADCAKLCACGVGTPEPEHPWACICQGKAQHGQCVEKPVAVKKMKAAAAKKKAEGVAVAPAPAPVMVAPPAPPLGQPRSGGPHVVVDPPAARKDNAK